MGYNISAYVERKNSETGEWELATPEPVSTCLKYVFDDFKDYPRIERSNVSKELQEKFKLEKVVDSSGKETEVCYANFYTKTIQEIEDELTKEIKEVYTKLNMIVTALGCTKLYTNDGEEIDSWDESKERLTFPINKTLIDDLQWGYNTMRKIGQKEMFDLVANEYTSYGSAECRVVFVLT